MSQTLFDSWVRSMSKVKFKMVAPIDKIKMMVLDHDINLLILKLRIS